MKLEAGMELWRTGNGCLDKLKITHTTATQAVVQINERRDIRFDREQKVGEGFFAKGDSGYHPFVYYVSDEKFNALFGEKVRRREALRKFGETDTRLLSTEKLERLIKIAQE